MQSRPEMQAEIVPMSRICPHQSSLGAIPACERVRSVSLMGFALVVGVEAKRLRINV